MIEDNADAWLIIRAALQQGFPEVTPVWASHATQALTYLETASKEASAKPRLILQDVYLPRREDGWALLKTIKTHPDYQPIPLIVLSQSADLADIQMAYELEAASYITKPATFHQWVSHVYTLRSYWLNVVTLPTSLT